MYGGRYIYIYIYIYIYMLLFFFHRPPLALFYCENFFWFYALTLLPICFGAHCLTFFLLLRTLLLLIVPPLGP